MSEVEYEDTDVYPTCPSCKKAMRKLLQRQEGVFNVEVHYLCPHCHAFLGVAKWNAL